MMAGSLEPEKRGTCAMKRKFQAAAAFALVAMLSQSLVAGSANASSNDKGADDQTSWQRDLLA